MTVPTLNYVSCPEAGGSHRMAYWLWGEADAPHVVVCAHGLSRQGRDFDTLAEALVEAGNGRVRVACPDVVGRGRSEWLADPMGYGIPTYVADMLQLLAVLHGAAPVTRLAWVGTSMGGLIGMTLAGAPGLPLPAPIGRLVLNDVGPVIEWSALQRIGTYLGNTGRFDTVQEAADAMWQISRGFGPHTPEQWLALSQAMVKSLPGGGFTLHYDPAIAVPFRALTAEAAAAGQDMLWKLYDAVRARTLLLRGADSDLLSPATAQEMMRRGPQPRLVEFAGVGHAPTLVAPDQVEAVRAFLLAEQEESLPDEKPRSGTG
jgi:pimeloyl-ACP methyl ester carboxylesterase